MSLTDAGFSHNNNPTQEGTNEIEWMYGTESIGIVVSVGTARRDEGYLKRGPLAFKKKLKGIAQKATDTERVHIDMEKNSARDGFPYYRLNDPEGLKMELDEWEPKPGRFDGKDSGSKTLDKIRTAFFKWALDNTVQIQRCAEELVECRRARSAPPPANRAKWERFATGAEFICRVKGCEGQNFENCEQFRQHLAQVHGATKEKHFKQELAECRRDWRYQSAPKTD